MLELRRDLLRRKKVSMATVPAANSEKDTMTLKWNTYQEGMQGREIFKNINLTVRRSYVLSKE